MICPECGSLTSNDQAFCTNCGAFVRSRFGKILVHEPPAAPPVPLVDTRHEIAPAEALDEIEWSAVESDLEPDRPDAELWPQETVFVPTLDEAPASPSTEIPAAADTVFEDDHADDFFEQSLSGRIRREDLDAEEPLPQQEYPPVGQQADADEIGRVTAEVLSPATLMELRTEISPDDAAALAPAVPLPRPASRRLGAKLAMLAYLLTLPLVFAGGVWLGSLYSELRGLPMPSNTDVPPVGLAPSAPVPPPGMAFVSGGEFLMGSDLGDPLSRPTHLVNVGPFFMDRFEVTNAEFAAFIKATGQRPPDSWKDGMPEGEAVRLPVTGVTWYQAAEYAAWAGKRLPTEAEWEFAARGTDGRIYPWGDEWDPKRANVDGDARGVRPGSTSGASPFGIYDMSGNAWEWTSSDARPYPGGKQVPWSRLRLKVIRGGNWQSGERAAAAIFRGYYGAEGERDYSGTSFRCVKDIPELR